MLHSRFPPMSSSRHQQRGVSMIELMISMALGLLLIAGIGTVFLGSREGQRVQSATARLQEDSRFAFYMLAHDLRMAGFRGCSPPDLIDHTQNPASPSAGTDPFTTLGIAGTDGGSDPDKFTLLTTADAGLHLVTPYPPNSSATLFVETNKSLNEGDTVLLSDCGAGDFFMITSTNTQASGSMKKIEVGHNTGTVIDGVRNYNQGVCTNPGSNPHCLSKSYDSGAMLYRISSISYEVKTNAHGDLALYRQEDNDAPNELISGIDDLQLLYGQDLDGDGSADRYLSAGDPALDMEEAVSLRMTVTLATSSDERISSSNADGRLRQSFSTTVAIRNRAL